MNKLPWRLADLEEVPKNGKTVFSCFHCGGGSTMGYKLAGYDVLGGVEIDKDMMGIYRTNHKPRFSYLMGVHEFKNIPNDQLPEELFSLDILDGSPPCSSFSMAGRREEKWGKASKFREGQAHQVLDDLFFHFIDVAAKLRPKVVIAENVKGLLKGNAKGYVKEIFQAFKAIGYDCQLFLVNAKYMGVPQKRERTFFIANRLSRKVQMSFTDTPIPAWSAIKDLQGQVGKRLSPCFQGGREWCLKHGTERMEDWAIAIHKKRKYFTHSVVIPWKPACTQLSTHRHIHPYEERRLSDLEVVRLQTFPDDFEFVGQDAGYVCGMSVPPFMMSRVSTEVLKIL